MDQEDDNLTPAELLKTAEKLLKSGKKDQNMYRAAILEAITALESNIQNKTFPILQSKVGNDLAKWLEEKTRMDFDTRLGLFTPLVTGLNVDKKDRLWCDYKKAKEIRNRITHSGKKVTFAQARSVIDTVYEWIGYLKEAHCVQAQFDKRQRHHTSAEILGKFIQASARLERVIYNALIKSDADENRLPRYVPSLDDLRRLSLIDDLLFKELKAMRALRNQAVHAGANDKIIVTESHVKRLNEIVDQIEGKLGNKT